MHFMRSKKQANKQENKKLKLKGFSDGLTHSTSQRNKGLHILSPIPFKRVDLIWGLDMRMCNLLVSLLCRDVAESFQKCFCFLVIYTFAYELSSDPQFEGKC